MPSLGLGLGLGLLKSGGSGAVGGNKLVFDTGDLTAGSINTGVGGDLTYTRAGNATYVDSTGVIQTAGANVVPFDHAPLSPYEPLGIIFDEGETNNVTDSENFTYSGTAWTGSAGSVANSDTAPDGTTGMHTLSSDGIGLDLASATFAGALAGERQTASLFVKKGTGTMRLALYENGSTAHQPKIDLDTAAGTLSNEVDVVASGVVEFDNHWRIWFVSQDNSTGATATAFRIYPRNTIVAGSISAWGASLIHSPTLSSYIPSLSGVSGTRSHATFRSTGNTWFNNGKDGTTVIDCSMPIWLIDPALLVKDTPTATSTDYLEGLMISDGSDFSNTVRGMVRTDPVTERFRYKITGINLSSLVSFTWADNVSKELFCRWNSTTATFYVDGTLRDTRPITPPGTAANITQVDVGGTFNDTVAFRGHIQRVRYYNNEQPAP